MNFLEKMPEVYFSLGSNCGDRMEYLRKAINLLSQKIKVIAVSPVYESLPWGYEDDQNYFNCVVRAETDLPPEEILRISLDSESELGRVRSTAGTYEARNIDIDILLYNQQIKSNSELTLPHPRMHLRNFVLVPLCELKPELIHPVFQKTMCRLLEESIDTELPVKLDYGI